jgi:alpha-mannosidase
VYTRYIWPVCALAILLSVNPPAEAAQNVTDRVASRIESMGHLPEGAWKYHAGDIAHGESVDLNDTAWPVAVKDKTASKDAVWFRQWIEVPKSLDGYDLTGTRIWFRFQTNENAPQIIYFNGRRVALGEDLEPIVLFENAKPGDKILIAVKLLATEHAKRFRSSKTKIDFSDSRPNPEDLRQELLAGEHLLPNITGIDSKERKALDTAAAEIDLKALDGGDQKRFDDSLRAAEKTLAVCKPALRTMHLSLAGNSHIDAAWLWPWTETVDVVRRTFSTALQLMNEYPDYTYTQSAAIYNDWIAQKYPDLDRQIQKRIREGRWEIVGGMWVEPDLNLPDGESTARSLLIGKRWYMQHYGIDVKIGWNPDSFGYSWQLPQIYKKSGIDYFVTQKMGWNETNQLPLNLFWWQSPDGSKVLTYFSHGYSSRDLAPGRLSADLEKSQSVLPKIDTMMDLYGVGDHGGGPTRAMLDEGVHWIGRDAAVPEMKFSTASDFFSTVEKKLDETSSTWNYASLATGFKPPVAVRQDALAIPTWNDELYLEYHRGVFTTQAELKRNLRQAPVWALNAEKLASLAWLRGDAYPGDALTDDWKTITFNDFHDLAAGSGVAAIYKDSANEFEQVHRSTNEISAHALDTLAAVADTRVQTAAEHEVGSGSVPVLVFNSLAWKRAGVVRAEVQMPVTTDWVSVVDAAGHTVPSTVLTSDAKTNRFTLLIAAKEMPSMGYQVLQATPKKLYFSSDLKVSGTTLENALLRVAIDPVTGCITSLYQKKEKFESLAAGSCGNELQAFEDKPKEYDAWNIDPGTLDQKPQTLTGAESVKLIESNPLRAVMEVRRKWQHSFFVQRIVLYAGADQVDVENDIDWAETHVLLKAAFALSATSSQATYEIPFGTIERPTTRNNTWEKTRFEVPALRWADLGDAHYGFSLINDSKYGYDSVGNLLRLTLLRSPTHPDPQADRGHHHFTYTLYPHTGDWRQARTVERGYEDNVGLIARQVPLHTGTLGATHSFVSVEGADVALTAVKKAEDSNALIVHLYEWAGKSGSIQLHVPAGATAATETNLLEQPAGAMLPVHNDSVNVLVHPYEILSVRIDYPQSGKE